MYRELLDEFLDISKTASPEELEILSTQVLAGMDKLAAKEDKDLTQAQIGIREGAKVGGLGTATGGVLYGASSAGVLSQSAKALGKNVSAPAVLAGIAATSGAVGAALGAILGGVHGKIMDRRERKFKKEDKEYNPINEGKNIGLIGGALSFPPAQVINMPAGWYVGKRIGERYARQNAPEPELNLEEYFNVTASYTELLDTLEKAASELSTDELEVLASEILKEAGIFVDKELNKEYKARVKELDREYLALYAADEAKHKKILDTFKQQHGRRPTAEERKVLKDNYMKDFWQTIENVAPDHAKLGEDMVAQDPNFFRKHIAGKAAVPGAILLGVPTGAILAAKSGVSIPIAAATGAAIGSGIYSGVGYMIGAKQDTDALKRLREKQASYTELLGAFEKAASELSTDELEVLASEILKEAMPNMINLNGAVKSVKTFADNSVKSVNNAVNSAGKAAKQTTQAVKDSATKVKDQMANNTFVSSHPYVSTVAAAGAGFGAGTVASNPPWAPNLQNSSPQGYTMVPVPTNMIQQ